MFFRTSSAKTLRAIRQSISLLDAHPWKPGRWCKYGVHSNLEGARGRFHHPGSGWPPRASAIITLLIFSVTGRISTLG